MSLTYGEVLPSSDGGAATRTQHHPAAWLRLVPGLALLFLIGYAGKLAESGLKDLDRAYHLGLPTVEYVLWAIIFGLVVGNLFGSRSWFRVFDPGIATYEFWLKLGIVFLGVRFLLADVLRLGGISLVLVLVELAVAIGIMLAFGRLFGLGEKLTALLAIGSSICGVSAIIATKGAIDADDRDASFAIAAILALGALGLFAYPLIGHVLGLSDQAFGVWAGLAVDNTAEAAAAGALYSDAAGKVAVLTKTTRNALIGFVVLGAALWFAARGKRAWTGSKAAFVWAKFPKFVLGFLLFSALASVAVFDRDQVTSLANLSRWAFLLTFAGVGLRTNFGEIRRQRVRPFVVGALAELSVSVVTLGLVAAVDRWIGF
jgi:uncharacterized integral membrane protein (TIGR00698 family)